MTATVSLNGIQLVDFSAGADDRKKIVFLCRDVGGWTTLLPVIMAMTHSETHKPIAALSGKAQEAWWKTSFPKTAFQSVCLLGEGFIPQAPAVFVTAGSWSDHHLEIAARELFPDTPMVYVENNYQQYRRLFDEFKKRGLKLPEKMCCIDFESQRDLIEAYPECLKSGSVLGVSGQPAFDRFAAEDKFRKRDALRTLGLEAGASLVTIMMASPKDAALVIGMAKALRARAWRQPPIFTVRKHPSDEMPASKYAEYFDARKFEYLETEKFDTDTVSQASHVVLTSWSTEGIHAVLRGIPVIYVVDKDYVTPDAGMVFPLPPARVGAALHCETVADAALFVQMLSDHEHPYGALGLGSRMLESQATFYRDGNENATENVLHVILDASS